MSMETESKEKTQDIECIACIEILVRQQKFIGEDLVEKLSLQQQVHMLISKITSLSDFHMRRPH